MNPRHLAIAVVSFFGLVGLFMAWWFSMGAAPPPDPAPAPSAETPPAPSPEPEPPVAEIPLPPLPDPTFVPAPLPEHVESAAFNAVIDRVRDTCGFGAWREVDRWCDGLRCSLLVSVLADDSKPYPTADNIPGCPAWLEAWGPRHDGIAFRVECQDGDDWDIALLGPHTQRMADKAATGASIAVTQEEIRARVCGPEAE